MTAKIVPVIMCGGGGTRLWPASREHMPKQFMPLVNERSLFQDTVFRVTDAALFDRPVVVTAERYSSLVAEQLDAIAAAADIVLEPERRDTAPAVAAVSALAFERRADTLLLLLASDHAIRLVDRFHDACRAATAAAQAGSIVAFGIVPDHPSPDYGYLKPGATLAHGVRKLDSFVEKPDAATAEAYIAEGRLWNSGNLLFRADVMKAELEKFQPAIWTSASQALSNARKEGSVTTLERAAFASSPRLSIDYAVMEKTSNGVALPIETGWSDLGSWDSIWTSMPRDAVGNAVSGPCELLDVRNSIVRSDGSLLAAVVGLDDVAVVIANGAVLVAPRSVKGEMKTLLECLKAAGRPEAD